MNSDPFKLSLIFIVPGQQWSWEALPLTCCVHTIIYIKELYKIERGLLKDKPVPRDGDSYHGRLNTENLLKNFIS